MLPYESTHAVWHVAAVGLHGGLDGIALQYHAYVEEVLEIVGHTEFVGHVFADEVVGIRTGTLVGHHDFGVDIPVALLRSV